MTSHILLVDCPDQRGLVHAITGVLLRHGCNVLSNHEFVDHELVRFFMRTEFAGEIEPERIATELRAALPAGADVQLSGHRRPRIVVLATKEHHCLGELLIRHAFGELGGDIAAVISNYDSLRALVQKFELPYHNVSHEGLSREQHEAQLLAQIAPYQPDYIVLAKYMRVLTSAAVARYPYRLINIHHSFLPAFVGASPYRQAWARGVKIIGATAHFVTNDLDEGPIIAQNVIPVDHSHSPEDMAQAGRDVEKIVLAKALKLVFEARVFRSGNRTIIFE
ncbi:formyltetrahydrofolate deformylase [Permianibacter sp. IMCC34836]|uniref:formyltetrahydrofolate deformylase n=1 Tax=Permianibacter fluminis TaxID=2738515 RepID=UPI001555A373|nr:formyltetrahydrofolate deformylase [Permianibacter fluminis]NQD37724.1 formyltetrahydrofolate deformylase [Permianibacter fluminis]